MHRETEFVEHQMSFKIIVSFFVTAFFSVAHAYDLLPLYTEKAKSATNGISAVSGIAVLPESVTNAQTMLCIKDRDGNWYQQLMTDYLQPGTNNWSFDLSPESSAKWELSGHSLVWNRRSLITPQFFDLKIFSSSTGTINNVFVSFCDFQQIPRPLLPPEFSSIRQNTAEVPCFGLFEVRFRLPDRYEDPFDPNVIDVSATITSSDTNVPAVTIPGFYTQDYYVTTNDYSDERTPVGRPEWAIRFSPHVTGEYTCRIVAADVVGVTTSTPVVFNAIPSEGPDFVRVSSRDWRRFEVGGKEFHPIGHNIRSPFDTRLDDQFPWVLRHPGSFMVYKRYFADMAKAGENIAEVWMCQWSLGLEWSTVAPYYHGVGDYNLGNAWELDQVLRLARENGIRVNLVLNNHGRAGLGFDAEWQNSPYNVARGGFLPEKEPMQFFTDARAIEYQKRVCRYIAARWGWDSTVFAWELWSELDLCGTHGMKVPPQRDAGVIEWHKQIGDFMHTVDPNRHLISTHISADHNSIGEELSRIQQIDHCCVDAYHWSRDPLHIVNLVRDTASHLGKFQKPALITEFGGNPMGAGLSHLKCELHAALWASACSTLAATPFFWWWGLIDEQNLYPEYTAVKNFMDTISYVDPGLSPVQLSVHDIPTPSSSEPRQYFSMALSNSTNLYAWIYTKDLIDMAKGGKGIENKAAEFIWNSVSNGMYRVAFCSTSTGLPIKQQDYRPVNGQLQVPIPPFTGDIAVIVRPVTLP